jgi:dienelactone hydrolase
MTVSRREFCEWVGMTGVGNVVQPFRAAGKGRPEGLPYVPSEHAALPDNDSHVGSLYPFIQKQADRSPLELSFLKPQFRNLEAWQKRARARVFEHLFYAPAPVAPAAQIISRADKGDHIVEYLTFQTTPDLRVPAYVLIPKNAKFPAPGIVALHDHGGFYLWGKEKIIARDDEHEVLRAFKQQYYDGRSVATELARQGYVVIVIDMFFWGERRMLLKDDPPVYDNREKMTKEDISAFNRRSQQSESLVARSLFTAGLTWPGVILWDDIRTLDYLASRPEVDARRLGCVGLSVGGYRSFLLAALDPRIKVAVDVGWMTSFGSQISKHVMNTVGLTFHIIGLYRYLDLPDLAALIAPRSVMVINGSRDRLFALEGVEAAFKKVALCYGKAGAAERQRCRMYDAPHQFNAAMQSEAWEFIRNSIYG